MLLQRHSTSAGTSSSSACSSSQGAYVCRVRAWNTPRLLRTHSCTALSNTAGGPIYSNGSTSVAAPVASSVPCSLPSSGHENAWAAAGPGACAVPLHRSGSIAHASSPHRPHNSQPRWGTNHWQAGLQRQRLLRPPKVATVEPEMMPSGMGPFFTPQEYDLQRYAMTTLTNLTTYPKLRQWLQQQLQMWEDGTLPPDPSSVVLALTSKVPEMEEGFWTSLSGLDQEQVLALSDVREEAAATLLGLVRDALPVLPLDTVAACVGAASDLDEDAFYDEEFFNTVAQRVMDCARSIEDAAAARSIGPHDSPALLECRPESLQENLRLLCGAFSRSGHYVPTVMQLLAEEVCASVHVLDSGLMAWIVWSFMELQHYNRDMLNKLGVQLLRPANDSSGQLAPYGGRPPLNITTLTPVAAAYVASAFAFFNVQNPAFYQVLLARMSAAQLHELDFSQAAQMFIACQMVPRAVPIPRGLTELLARAAERDLAQLQESVRMHRDYVSGGLVEEDMVQVMLQYQDYDSLCLRQLRTVLSTCKLLPEGKQEELFVPASPQTPWILPHMCIPGQGLDGQHCNVYMQLLNDDCFCRNVKGRLRGYTQASIRSMQRLGVAWWALPLDSWIEQVEDAAGAVGLPEHYADISLLWAQSLSPTGITDPALKAKLHDMVMELGNYVDTCVKGAITIQQQQQAAWQQQSEAAPPQQLKAQVQQPAAF